MDSSLKSSIRSVVIGSNFIFSVVLTIWMIFLSNNKDRVGAQTFKTSISLQTHEPSIANTLRNMTNNTAVGVADIPFIMVSDMNDSFFTIAAVHPQFLFFTSLIISSCFAVTTFTFPWGDVHFFSVARVMLVHIWNLLGLVALVVLYTTYSHWQHIPLSNFLYTVALVGLTWLYSYWHMVDSTATWLDGKGTDNLSIAEVKNAPTGDDKDKFDLEESHTVRRNVMQEFSLTFPLYLASTLLQGNAGMDQWRLQTVFFASWAFFALYGVFYRFKQTHDARVLLLGDPKKHEDERKAATNALAFVSCAMIIMYIQLILAIGNRILFSSARFPYFTDSLNTMKVGQFMILFTMTFLLLDVARAMFAMQMDGKDNLSTDLRFGANMVFIVSGSILTKLFYFLALSNSDSWTIVS